MMTWTGLIRRSIAMVRPGALAVSLLYLPACGGSATGPGDQFRQPAPPLEQVAYEQLGSEKIMFQRTTEPGAAVPYSAVYVVNGATRSSFIALDHDIGFGPALSPNADAIARLNITDTQSWYDVYITGPTGANPVRVSSLAGNSEGFPSWTPDGAAVVYLAGGPGSTPWGILHSTRGGTTTQLHAFTVQPGEGSRCPSTDAYSSDGRQVVASVRGGLAYVCGTSIVFAETASDPLVVSYSPTTAFTSLHGPAWSPDGTTLAFAEVRRASSFGEILSTTVKVLDPATGNVQTLADVPGSGGGAGYHGMAPASLCYLPSGNAIVFTAAVAGRPPGELPRTSVHVMRSNGSGLVRFTTAANAVDATASCAR